MKIQYTAFAPPHLQGTTTHLQPHIAQNLIAAGIATHVPYKNYVERLSEEAREGTSPHNTQGSGPIQGIEWSVSTLPNTGTVVMWRKSRIGEITRVTTENDAISLGVPDGILREFRELTAAQTCGINWSELSQVETAKQKNSERGLVWEALMRKA